MSRKISIQILADQLGLSKYAVSRALSGKPGVSAATRQRVIDLARTLGYQNSSVQDVSVHKSEPSSSYILICISQIHADNPSYWQRVLNGLLQSCGKLGLQYIIVSPEIGTQPASISPQKAIAPHIDWSRCAGIVMIGTFPHPLVQLISRTECPYVLVDHVDPLVSCDKVNNDNIEAGLKITRHLLAQKCKNIVFLNDEVWSSSFADRLTGAKLAVDSLGDPKTKLTEWKIPYGGTGWEQSVFERLTGFKDEDKPDAWIGANDDIAICWMRKLQAEGFPVPDRFRVAGIDNVETSALISPKLTTVNLCKEELGQRALETLLRRIERPGAPVETIHLSTNLIPRSST
ncbi:LacI family DNA-binding transcriptional regulator [Paenibacillus puldeungensis]|uniref:LacI family DNA-binding transcriptional regulator n=1 Tax=Paenibacillus puldeungensis TaxID=696536 RepID=A0ABW3RRT8_9BACL